MVSTIEAKHVRLHEDRTAKLDAATAVGTVYMPGNIHNGRDGPAEYLEDSLRLFDHPSSWGACVGFSRRPCPSTFMKTGFSVWMRSIGAHARLAGDIT